MLKKEFKEIIKQATLFFLLMGFLILVFKIRSVFGDYKFNFTEYFLIFYQLFIFIFSFFFGISMFSNEIRNNGFEYMLTLPFSRAKLLMIKILPRLAVLILLYLVYLILLSLSASDPFLITPVLFNSLYFSLFLVSTSFSVLRGNFVANSLFTLFSFFFLIVAANLIAWLVTINYFGKSMSFKLSVFTVEGHYPFNSDMVPVLGFLLAIPFTISLFYGFKKYDIRSPKRYMKRFSILFVPLFLAGMLLSYFALNSSIYPYYESFYITEEGAVLKNNMVKTTVIDKGGEREIGDSFPIWLWWGSYEWNGSLYTISYRHRNYDGKILKIDKTNFEVKDVYVPEENKHLARLMYGYKNYLVFFEKEGKKHSKKKGGTELVFFNIKTSEVKKVKTSFNYSQFCGVAEVNNKRLWVGYYIKKAGLTIYSVDEDGNYKEVTRSELNPVYSNEMLVTYTKGHFQFGKFSESGYEIVKRVKEERGNFYNHNNGCNDLNRLGFKFLYGRKYKDEIIEKFLMIDLENLEITSFDPGKIKKGFIRRGPENITFFTSFTNSDPIELDKIYKFKGEGLVMLKDFKEVEWSLSSDFRHLKNGFIIREGRKVRFFTYPDLKELKF